MKLSGKDLFQYYRAKKVKDNCPFCASTDWLIPSDDPTEEEESVQGSSAEKPDTVEGDGTDITINPLVVHFTLKNLNKEKTDQWYRVMTMICSNCGYVRLQQWKAISDWITAGRPGIAEQTTIAGDEE